MILLQIIAGLGFRVKGVNVEDLKVKSIEVRIKTPRKYSHEVLILILLIIFRIFDIFFTTGLF